MASEAILGLIKASQMQLAAVMKLLEEEDAPQLAAVSEDGECQHRRVKQFPAMGDGGTTLLCLECGENVESA